MFDPVLECQVGRSHKCLLKLDVSETLSTGPAAVCTMLHSCPYEEVGTKHTKSCMHCPSACTRCAKGTASQIPSSRGGIIYILSGACTGVAIVVTDGGCCTVDTLKAAGDSLRSLGVTVVGVGIGFADINALNALASTDSDGNPLVFSGDEFDQIESLLVGALKDIGSFSRELLFPNKNPRICIRALKYLEPTPCSHVA